MAKTGISFENAGVATIARVEESQIATEFVDLLCARLLEGKDVPSGRRFVLDLSKVTFLGSTGLSVIVVFLKRLRECGGELALAALSEHCMSVLKIMRFTEIIPVYDDVQSALNRGTDTAFRT